MAIKLIQQVTDDLDGSVIDSDIDGTVSFALRGQTYELELSKKNQDKLEELLAPFIAVARKAGTGLTSDVAEAIIAESQVEVRPYKLRDARDWLREQGHEVAVRGPVDANLVLEYEKAHGFA